MTNRIDSKYQLNSTRWVLQLMVLIHFSTPACTLQVSHTIKDAMPVSFVQKYLYLTF